MQTQTYIVRIYRRNGAPGLAGVVEIVQRRKSQVFRNFDELRSILDQAVLSGRLQRRRPKRSEI